MGLSKEHGPMRSLYWVLASIISTSFAIACRIIELEMDAENLYDAIVYDSGLYRCLGLALAVLPIASLVLGVGAVVLISKNWKARKTSAAVELLILAVGALSLFGSYYVAPESYRNRKVVSNNMLFQMINVGDSINEYSKKHNHMPDASEWCDSLINEPNLGIDKHDFHIAQLGHIQSNFAFNKNLSNLSLDELEANVVLLFEADGNLNLSGDDELTENERYKDRYFLFRRQLFIYILFIDGSVVRYRLRDGAIAKYDEKVNAFTAYVPKGKTAYSPLRWKP